MTPVAFPSSAAHLPLVHGATEMALPAAPPDRLVGRRYTLGKMIGRGGNCEVFEAVHVVTRRVVALKLLRAEFRDDVEARVRLGQEARALASVRHPHLLDVLDADVDGQVEPFVAVEMLRGKTLEDTLAERARVGILEAVTWIRKVAQAVAELHRAGWVHRDIKPANIFLAELDETIQPKLLDLGIAVPRGLSADERLTVKGTILGTVPYMAPEQVTGEDAAIDARTDVWQLGATLFDMLTGQVPFPGHYANVLVQMATGSAPRARSLRPEVPAVLDALVARALSRDPGDRFEDAAALARALATVEATLAAEVAPASGRRLRAQFVAPLRALLPTSTLDLRTEELSAEGLRVVSSHALAEGALVCLRMALPISGRVANVPCVVRRVENRGTGQGARAFAIGLDFVDGDPEMLREAANYVQALGA